ncbi:MAG: hutH, partial [Nevskia sp.]|nr:hutH [Nevskia sp.]
LLAAAQGIDFHAPLETSPVLLDVQALVRGRVPFYAEDRYFAPDIEAVTRFLGEGKLTAMVGSILPSFA